MFVFAMMILSPEKLLSQNPIPSFNVPIIIDPTVFEEVPQSFNTLYNLLSPFPLSTKNSGEKKLVLIVTDRDLSVSSWVEIEVYSLDGAVVYGPFTVNEGVLFEMILSTSLTWGVRIIDASEGSMVDVWFD